MSTNCNLFISKAPFGGEAPSSVLDPSPKIKIENLQNKKQQIFQINNYNFLKKKRQESVENSKKKKNWTEEEDLKLKKLLINYPHLSWNEISLYFPERSKVQCLHRWSKVLKPGLRKGKWSQDEDDVLKLWVDKQGAKNWGKLSTILKGRTSKQIRDRWVNNLNPERFNFKWTDELDKLLLGKYLIYGSSWVQISKYIENSTENMIKNRFYSLLRSCASRNSKAKHNKNKNNISLDFIEENKNAINLKKELKTRKKNEYEKFLAFDFEDDDNDEENNNNFDIIKQKKYKRKNHSLTYLIDFLPYLLEEKGVQIDNSNNKTDTNIPCNKTIEQIPFSFDDIVNKNNSQGMGFNSLGAFNFNFNEEQKSILANFFTTLSGKFPFNIDNLNKNNNKINYNLNNVNNPTLTDNINNQNNKFKVKSTILLNLQLTQLHKIFARIKLQMVQKFFEFFKENTIST
jgi:hypothetical protein